MRKVMYLPGVLLAAGALAIGAVQIHAAEPKLTQGDCRISSLSPDARCAAAKPVRAVQKAAAPATSRVAKAALDRNVCSRLQTQLERDTCLNRVEATV